MLRFIFSRELLSTAFPRFAHPLPSNPARGSRARCVTGSSGAERTRLLSKVMGAATNPQVSVDQPWCLQCFSMLCFDPRLPSFPSSCCSVRRAAAQGAHLLLQTLTCPAWHTGLWEGQQGNSSIVTEKLAAEQERYSSTSGGGARCSWKVSFWKTLLVAGSPCATLSSPCFSPWVRDSSVRRASCKTKPRQRQLRPLKRLHKVQKGSELAGIISYCSQRNLNARRKSCAR